MRNLISFVSLLLVVFVIGVFSKPTLAGVEDAIRIKFQEELASRNPRVSGDAGRFAATLFCKADHDACYRLLRQGLNVEYQDRYAYARIDLSGFKRQVTCYGAFMQFWCGDTIAP